MKIEIPPEIRDWSIWLSSGLLGEEKFPLCPWARKTVLENAVDFWVNDHPEELVPLPLEIKVRIVHLPNKTRGELEELRISCNLKSREYVFLDSHPEDDELIGKIKSVAPLPLILIQKRDELEIARKTLRGTKYYQYWDSEVLKKLLEI